MFFNTIFHLASSTVNLVVDLLCVANQIGHYKARVGSLGGVLGFGIGLPEQEPERIFERFFSTKREGMGMGLAIARSIIASHGGELAAANADGGGACVYFSLPVTGKDQ